MEVVPAVKQLDRYTWNEIMNREWSYEPAGNIERGLSASVAFAKSPGEDSYKMTVKVFFQESQQLFPPIYQPFRKYLKHIAIGLTLSSAQKAWRGGKPPYPIANVRVELYQAHTSTVVVEPATPYKTAVTRTETRQDLLYASFVAQEEILKASDWSYFVRYCHDNPDFFLTRVCRDVYRKPEAWK